MPWAVPRVLYVRACYVPTYTVLSSGLWGMAGGGGVHDPSPTPVHPPALGGPASGVELSSKAV